MPEFGQPAALERLLFWARTAGIFFLLLGLISTFSAGWLSARLDSLRKADLNRLEEKVHNLESRPEPVPVVSPVTVPSLLDDDLSEKPPSGRQISALQHKTLATLLLPLADTKVVLLTLEDWETGNYAHQIAKTLRAGGLNVRLGYMNEPKPLDGGGLTCYWSKGDPDPGQRIINSMRDAGLTVNAYGGMPMGGAALEIHVIKAPEETTRAREAPKP